MCKELDRLYRRRARLVAVIRSLKAYQRVALRGLPASSGGAVPRRAAGALAERCRACWYSRPSRSLRRGSAGCSRKPAAN